MVWSWYIVILEFKFTKITLRRVTISQIEGHGHPVYLKLGGSSLGIGRVKKVPGWWWLVGMVTVKGHILARIVWQFLARLPAIEAIAVNLFFAKTPYQLFFSPSEIFLCV